MTFVNATMEQGRMPNRTVAAPQVSDAEFQIAVERATKEKTLKSDLERQLKEELKSDSDNPVPSATVFALRQKFGLAPLPTVAEIARSLKGTRR